jgi:hypothetical protein
LLLTELSSNLRAFGPFLLMHQSVINILLLVALASCAQFRIPIFGGDKPIEPIKDWKPYGEVDYRHHMEAHEKSFLAGEHVRPLTLSPGVRSFLENLALNILQSNELFFQGQERPRFHVVASSVPFHFSLPGRAIFLSTALINRHIKHEAVLASIIAYELVRSEKMLYMRTVVVPLGYMPVERMLGLSRIGVDEKIEVHKWAYHAIRRAGFDGEYYLAWLQLMNRNTVEFLPLLGDAGSISQEEAMFKAFMVKRARQEDARAVARRDSSKEFYQFIFFVKDQQV